MDFHSFSRRELQSLCKRNGIQANMTNLAMADALAALRSVEGVEDLLLREEGHQLFLSPKKAEAGSPEPPRTGRRTSTRLSARPAPLPQGSPLPRSRRVAARALKLDDEGSEPDQEKVGAPETPPRAPATERKGATARTARASKKEADTERTVGVTTRLRRAGRQSSTTADVAVGSISTRRRSRGRAAAAATKMADLTSKEEEEEEEENDVAGNVTISNDQAIEEEKDLTSKEEEEEENDVVGNVTISNDQEIGEEKDLIPTEESQEDQKATDPEIVQSNQENVTEQEQEEKEGLEANEEEYVQVEEEPIVEMAKSDQNEGQVNEEEDVRVEEEPIVEMAKSDQNEGQVNEEEDVQVEEEPIVEMAKSDQNGDQVIMSALEDSPVGGLISCKEPKEEGGEESGRAGADSDLLLLGLQRISISVEPKEDVTIHPAIFVQDESLGSCNDDDDGGEKLSDTSSETTVEIEEEDDDEDLGADEITASHVPSSDRDGDGKENADLVTITLTKAELVGSISLRKLKAMYKDRKIKEGEEKRSALKALDENCLGKI